MAYPVAADFRAGTLAEFCQGLALTIDDATDTILTPVIARMAKRLESICDDTFVSASATYDLRGSGTTQLFLPARCTAVSTVKTRDYLGNLTTQAATVYRLVSSLDAAGAVRVTGQPFDYLEIPGYQHLTGVVGQSGWTWPVGAETVQVVGTFGWTTTPGDVKRAVALLVYESVKAQAAHLRKTLGFQTADSQFQFSTEDPEHPTGINEVDDIIRDYRRTTGLLVG